MTTDDAIDKLGAHIESLGWWYMATEWQYPRREGIAAVCLSSDGPCFEATADHWLEALSRAYHKARTALMAPPAE
jgi:hypothetical protein